MESSYNPLYCSSITRQQSVMKHTLSFQELPSRAVFSLHPMHLEKGNRQQVFRSKTNDDINRLVRRAAVLPLLPMQNIEDVWLHTLEDIDNADTNINTVSFTDYVTEQWVENNRDLWNHHNTEGTSTTNHLERWHHK